MELSLTCASYCLIQMGQKYKQIDFFFDNSQYLALPFAKDMFSCMINKKETVFMKSLGGVSPVSYNLVKQPSAMDSKKSCGIQLADIIASSYYNFYSKSPRNSIMSHSLADSKNVWYIYPDFLLLHCNHPLIIINYHIVDYLFKCMKDNKDPLVKLGKELEYCTNLIINGYFKDSLLEGKDYKTLDQILESRKE